MRRIEFLDHWYFSRQGEDETLVQIPHTHDIMPLNYGAEEAYQFLSTYKKVLNISPRFAGERYFLRFEGVATSCCVYANGILVGSHDGGYTPFEVEIPSGEVEIKVEVDGRELAHVPPFGGVVDYLTYAGMYREVYLKRVSSQYIEDVFVTARMNGQFEVDVLKSGEGDANNIEILIIDQETVVKSMNFSPHDVSAKFEGGLENVKTWCVDKPHLYTMCVRLKKNDKILDEVQCKFGFRDVEFKKDGFYLNQKKIKLVGLNRHQCYPHVGDAMPKLLQQRDADILKYELGANVVRTSHYPQSKHFLNRCDEIGLLVFEEIVGWQHISEDPVWRDLTLQNVKDMIIRDRNHPSIIIWGVRINESGDCKDLYEQTDALAHVLDPTRQTGGVRNFEKSQLLEDVYTFNDFSNAPLLNPSKVCPDKTAPYLVTEHTGHMFPTKRFDHEEHRLEHALRHLKIIDTMFGNDRMSGAIGWCMFDYPTHGDFGSGDQICYHGVLDFNRIPKLAAAVYASQQDDKPVLEVGTSFDIGEHPGGLLGPIYVFTNCEYVKLYKDDVLINTFYPSYSTFKHVLHPPIVIDDLIGNALKHGEQMSDWDANNLKQVLMAASVYGMDLPLKYKIRMGLSLLRLKMSIEDGVNLYSKYVGNWGGTRTVYKLEGYKASQLVKTKTFGNVRNPLLLGKADYEVIKLEETYEVNRIVIQAVCENGNVLPYAFGNLKVNVEGPIELIGIEPTLIGGCAAVYVKTKGIGEACVNIGSDQYGSCIIKFKIC